MHAKIYRTNKNITSMNTILNFEDWKATLNVQVAENVETDEVTETVEATTEVVEETPVAENSNPGDEDTDTINTNV